MLDYFLCLILFATGIYALLTKRSIIKIIIALSVMGYAVALFLLVVGRGSVPVASGEAGPPPAAMVLAVLILVLAMTLFLAALAIRIDEKFGTTNSGEIRNLKG